jgi:hypothetical protein
MPQGDSLFYLIGEKCGLASISTVLEMTNAGERNGD